MLISCNRMHARTGDNEIDSPLLLFADSGQAEV